MPKSTNIRLDDIWITQMEKVWEILKKIWLNKNNSKIMWSEDTFRTDQSKDILTLYIWNKNLKKTGLLRSIKNDDIKLKDWTIWYTFKKWELGLIEVMDVSKDTLTCILQEKNKINDWSQIKNIVLVWHSSNKWVIEEVWVKHKKWEVLIDWKGFPTWWVIEIDINFNWDLINQADNKNILKLNIWNYEEIINILENKIQDDSYLDLLIKLQINRFKNQEIQIWELQNYINNYFIQNPSLFEEYLSSENEDIVFFCIVNLLKIKDKWIDYLLKKGLLKNFIEKVKEWKETEILDYIFTKIWKDESKKLKVLQELQELIQSLDSRTIMKKHKLEYYYNYMRYLEEFIDQIRQWSLDENIKNWKIVTISVNIEQEWYKTIDKLLNSNKQILIEADAWSGKSIKLLEILEYLKDPNKEILEWIKILFPIYVNLWKNKTIKEIDYLIKHQKEWLGKKKYKFIYLFDAVDEADFDEIKKQEFLNRTKELQKTWQVIITSRSGEILSSEIGKLNLKPLSTEQIETYIKSYVSWNKKLENIWNNIETNGFIEEIKGNPLMLSMIVELIKNTNKIKKLKDLWIIEKDISQIIWDQKILKSEFFDIIVNLRLYDWQEMKEDTNYTDEDTKNNLDERIKSLELIAWESIKKWDALTEDEIKSLISKYKLKWWEKDSKHALKNLNLIFKYNEKEKTYKFVHEKFKEYFLYRNYKKKVEWKEMNIEKNGKNI